MANAHVEFTYDGQNVELLFKGLSDADARTLYRIFSDSSRNGNNPHIFGFGWCGEGAGRGGFLQANPKMAGLLREKLGEGAAEGVAKAKEKKGKK